MAGIFILSLAAELFLSISLSLPTPSSLISRRVRKTLRAVVNWEFERGRDGSLAINGIDLRCRNDFTANMFDTMLLLSRRSQTAYPYVN